MSYAWADVADTILIDAVDLQGLDGVLFQPTAMDGLPAPVLRRGADVAVLNEDGQDRATDRPIDAYPFTVPVTVTSTAAPGSNNPTLRASAWANYVALITACRGTAGTSLCIITHRVSTGAGHDDRKALGEFNAARNFHWDDLDTISVDLEFMQASGKWTLGDPTSGAATWVVP